MTRNNIIFYVNNPLHQTEAIQCLIAQLKCIQIQFRLNATPDSKRAAIAAPVVTALIPLHLGLDIIL